MSITTKTDPAVIDQGNLLKSDWDTYSRCENYSITIKKNWNDAHNNKQLTMHNKYTNDDVDLDDCVAYMH